MNPQARIDADGGGTLDRTEIGLAIAELATKSKRSAPPEDEIDQLFRAADADGGGALDLTEFTKLCLAAPTLMGLDADEAEEEDEADGVEDEEAAKLFESPKRNMRTISKQISFVHHKVQAIKDEDEPTSPRGRAGSTAGDEKKEKEIVQGMAKRGINFALRKAGSAPAKAMRQLGATAKDVRKVRELFEWVRPKETGPFLLANAFMVVYHFCLPAKHRLPSGMFDDSRWNAGRSSGRGVAARIPSDDPGAAASPRASHRTIQLVGRGVAASVPPDDPVAAASPRVPPRTIQLVGRGVAASGPPDDPAASASTDDPARGRGVAARLRRQTRRRTQVLRDSVGVRRVHGALREDEDVRTSRGQGRRREETLRAPATPKERQGPQEFAGVRLSDGTTGPPGRPPVPTPVVTVKTFEAVGAVRHPRHLLALGRRRVRRSGRRGARGVRHKGVTASDAARPGAARIGPLERRAHRVAPGEEPRGIPDAKTSPRDGQEQPRSTLRAKEHAAPRR